jgi:hypothetical protein
MITITSNIHIVVLGLMRGNTELGLFAAAWKPFNFTIVLPNPIATLFLPRIANLTRRPAERTRTTTIYMQAIIVSVVPITLFGAARTDPADPDRPVRCALSSGRNDTWRAYGAWACRLDKYWLRHATDRRWPAEGLSVHNDRRHGGRRRPECCGDPVSRGGRRCFGYAGGRVGHSDIVCPKLSRGFGIAYSSLRRPVPDSGDTGSDRGSLCIDAADYRRL